MARFLQVKDHPGCNFVGLLFGSGGETHKRLEKVCLAGAILCYCLLVNKGWLDAFCLL